MTPQRDVRDFRSSRLSNSRIDELNRHARDVSERLRGSHRVEVTNYDATTGNAACVVSVDADAEEGDLVEAAVRHMSAIAPAFGLGDMAPEFHPDPVAQQTSSGTFAVHLQQNHKGIPIFQAAVTVQIRAERTITQVVGSVITAREESSQVTVSTTDAVRLAAEHVVSLEPAEADGYGQPLAAAGVELADFRPKVIAAFLNLPQTPTVLEPGPFEAPIQASLVWFPLDDHLVLAWDILLTLPPAGTVHRTLVSAVSGEVLFSQPLVHGLRAMASVHVPDGGSPRMEMSLPPPLSAYGHLVPTADSQPPFGDWVDTPESAGYFAVVRLGDDGPTVRGTQDADGAVRFDGGDEANDDQRAINLFYFNGVMHDLFYLLGFREVDGNFTADNLNRGGLGNDRVEARVCPTPIPRTARFITPPDGTPPTMLMGVVAESGRHCALDASIVYHEFTHGVSNRLVGGPSNASALLSPQSVGMGEGWSDFVACSVVGTTVVASWAVGDPAGIRSHPYDADHPGGFGELGTPKYSREHAVGEVWCATLMEMARNIGTPLALQLVVDAMKLSAPNPSFLNMRDAILAAADTKAASTGMAEADRSALSSGVWAAFAKFGMGPKAASNGAQLSGIVSDTQMPAASPAPQAADG